MPRGSTAIGQGGADAPREGVELDAQWDAIPDMPARDVPAAE
jgi:hypothetical protein